MVGLDWGEVGEEDEEVTEPLPGPRVRDEKAIVKREWLRDENEKRRK